MSGYVYAVGYPAQHADGFGAPDFDGYVVDLYFVFDDDDDVMLNTYNFNDINLGITYYQSITGTGWLPNNLGVPFETEAMFYADSFVSNGDYNGGVQPPANGTGLDPNFGGNNAPGPGENAGWYNSDPGTLNGQAIQTSATSTGIGVFIGRFSINDGELSMEDGTGFATWNQGIGTDGDQASFVIVPAPGALALLGVAGLAGRRRRN